MFRILLRSLRLGPPSDNLRLIFSFMQSRFFHYETLLTLSFSPTTVYTWTRDSALTTHGLLEVASAGSQTDQVLAFVNDYITAQNNLQRTSNPSGGCE